MIYENIIIGAGAAGLFCCANITKRCKNTLLLEANRKIAIKLLASGSGQCNFTHGGDIKDFLSKYSDNGKKIRKVLYKFNNKKVMEFFEAKGIAVYEREDGKVFPKSLRSKDIVEVLKNTILSKGINIITACKIVNIYTEDNSHKNDEATNIYVLENQKGEKFRCKNLIIATGGKSFPKTGSDGKILDILKNSKDFQIEIKPMNPALVAVYIENYRFQEISGVSIANASIKLFLEDKKFVDENDVLFTHKNLSGPLIINNSRYMKTGIKGEINFLNNFMKLKNLDETSLKKMFEKSVDRQKTLRNVISEIFNLPKSFVSAIILKFAEENFSREEDIEEFLNIKIKHLNFKTINKIIDLLIHYSFVVSGNEGFEKAMATTGGIILDDIDFNTMSHKKHPNLYFIGECLDVDGDTGGYNIQFAFSSGYIAAQHISQ